ncbi:nuclear transport factor 2 family protein [Frankia sp. Cas4]|uniref:nuclear transport factor 2 family protein n=1 Tax=Frankia sp. Cas4 TaxID=3073927 RepID=UPI002AD3886F|nr:nuclear transport factor 2 family protein [Frankia sp. Cas4]
MEHSTPIDVVNEYLASFYSGDFTRAAAILAADFSFQGPFLSVEGRDGFLSGAQGLRPVVRGHRLLRQWQDGHEVCSIYEVDLSTLAGSGSVVMSEWHTVRAGQLASGRVVFDTAPFHALMPARRG